jgi:hypothetical protein
MERSTWITSPRLPTPMRSGKELTCLGQARAQEIVHTNVELSDWLRDIGSATHKGSL